MRLIGFVPLIACPPWPPSPARSQPHHGQPQPGATVGFYKLVTAFQLAEEAKTDRQGNFLHRRSHRWSQANMIRTTYDGVGYIHMLPPDLASSGLTLDVLQFVQQPGAGQGLQQ